MNDEPRGVKRRIEYEEQPQVQEPSAHSADVTWDCPLCSAGPFASSAQLDSHWRSLHSLECISCRRVMPSAHILDLHIAENHDPLVKIRQERGERVFRCMDVACPATFRTPKGRRLHMIDVHQYPKTYVFSVVNLGVRSRLQQGKGLLYTEDELHKRLS